MCSSLVLAFVLQASFARDGTQWEVIYQMPRGNSLNAVCVIDDTTGVTVGDGGEIMITSDGGETWSHQAGSVGENLSACYGVSDHVWAVGDGGTIVHSDDTGDSWTQQTSNTSVSLQGCSFADSTTGWLVGSAGVILHTTDGGLNWNPQNSTVSGGLNSVAFVDDTLGWCVGGSGTILHTEDGGATWDTQTSGVSSDLNDVCFVNQQVGFIGADYPDGMLKTTDGGGTWEEVTNLPGTRLQAVHFVSDSVGSVVRRDGSLCHTTDGCATWQCVPVYHGNVNDLSYLPNDLGWCVGGDDGTFIARRSAWDDWELQIDETTVPLNAVHFVDGNQGWAVGGMYHDYNAGAPDVILHTTDGGFHWEKQVDVLGRGGYDVQFLDSLRGYAVSGQGVYRTTDGGQNWSYAYITSGGLMSVSFVDVDVGYLAGAYERIYKTTNGGDDWVYLDPGVDNTYFQSVCFVDDSTGSVSGYGWPSPFTSKIMHTSDGGSTWQMQYEELGGRTWLHFADCLHGWAVSVEGVVLHTEDGGDTWVRQTSNTSESLRDVFFADTSYGWAVGDNGVVLATEDGGINWAQDSTASYEHLYSVFAWDSCNAWAAGRSGTVLKRGEGVSADERHRAELAVPNRIVLSQNCPNPFHPVTTIHFSLSGPIFLTLKVYDLLGREIETLVKGQHQAGQYEVSWTAKDIPSGLYLYRLEAGELAKTKEMILQK